MTGDYQRAAAESERHWAPGNIGALALLCAGDPDAARLAQADAARYANTTFRNSVLITPEPDRALLRSAVDELIASGFRDPEGLFYQVIKLSHAGDLDRAVEIFAVAVDRGFYPYRTFTRHEWLDPLRPRQDFNAILEIARHRHEEARVAFVDAGGETLLGVEG